MNIINSLPPRLAPALGFVCWLACIYSQAASVPQGAPMGLARLAAKPESSDHRNPTTFIDVVDFESLPPFEHGAAAVKRQGLISYVAIPSGGRYETVLRDVRAAPTYVTFAINASAGTEIEISGVRLGIANSIDDGTYGSFMYQPRDRQGWMPLGYEAQMLPFSGTMMASLAPVTLKLDPPGECWSIWIADNLIASNLRLSFGSTGATTFIVKTGSGAAWLWGLAHAAENPLFEDGNHNAVPDDFERNFSEAQLPALASPESRSQLLAMWREAKMKMQPTALSLEMPAPDYIPEMCGPDGIAPLHNMPNAFRFQIPND